MTAEPASRSAVDVHAHVVPPQLLDDLEQGRLDFPGIEVVPRDGGRALAFAGGAATRPVPPPLQDAERRRTWMDEQRIDVQVVAGWLDMFGYALEPDEGAEWARTLSAHVKTAAAEDGRLVPLGSVALQDPAGAAEALRDLVDDGFPGVMIATQIGERELDDAAFEPFWEAADDLGAVVYLHPSFGASPRHAVHGLVNALARPEDTTLTLARLLYAGVPARRPRMKLIASHGGGTLPYVIGRLARNQAVVARDAADPLESLAQLYFDTVVFEPAALRLLLECSSPDRVLLGSDYPFPIGDLTPRGVVERADLDEDTVKRILTVNACELFGIDLNVREPGAAPR
jgi:aminocarboxymuconate-semialdehyde decarboxylase